MNYSRSPLIYWVFATLLTLTALNVKADDRKKLPQKLALSQISLQQAIEIALSQQAGLAYGAELEDDSFFVEYEVKILSGQHRYKVTIDGISGEIKRIRKRN